MCQVGADVDSQMCKVSLPGRVASKWISGPRSKVTPWLSVQYGSLQRGEKTGGAWGRPWQPAAHLC